MHLFLYYRGFPKTCQYFHFVSRLPHDFFSAYSPTAKLVNGFLCSGPFRMNMRIPSIAYLTKKKHASLHPWEYAEREISMGRCSNRTSFSIERSRCRPKKEKDFSPS